MPDGTIQTADIGTPAGAVDPALTGQPVLGGAVQTDAMADRQRRRLLRHASTRSARSPTRPAATCRAA